MVISPGLHRFGTLDVESTRRDAEQAGYLTFMMPRGIADGTAFIDAVRAIFPLDPPIVGGSWDALSDSLSAGLHTHLAQRIAILWPEAGAMARSAPEDFEIAMEIFADLASTLADPQMTSGRPKEVAVIVEIASP